MRLSKILVKGAPAVACAAIIVASEAAYATTGTQLDAGGNTLVTMIQGAGGVMMAAGLGIAGLLWKVIGNNVIWGAVPGVAGGLITANSQAIATQFGGGTGLDLLSVASTMDAVLSNLTI